LEASTASFFGAACLVWASACDGLVCRPSFTPAEHETARDAHATHLSPLRLPGPGGNDEHQLVELDALAAPLLGLRLLKGACHWPPLCHRRYALMASILGRIALLPLPVVFERAIECADGHAIAHMGGILAVESCAVTRIFHPAPTWLSHVKDLSKGRNVLLNCLKETCLG